MKDFCHFLDLEPSGMAPRCESGVNFASVGFHRERCCICPLADLGEKPLCPNVDVYTFLDVQRAGNDRIEVQFDCAGDHTPKSDERCPNCPDTLETTSRAPESLRIPSMG